MQHLITVNDLTLEEIQSIFQETSRLRVSRKFRKYNVANMGLIFSEKSTRTRLSFDLAAKMNGYGTVHFDTSESSILKGESIADTIKTVSLLCKGGLVIRHSESFINTAKEYSMVPIINAGSGAAHHPTQAILDLYVINKYFSDFSELNVLILGDLTHARTIHSFCQLFERYNANIRKIAIDEKMPQEEYYEHLKWADVIYITRIQSERRAGNTSPALRFGEEELKVIKKNTIVLHPGPRTDEVTVDNHHQLKWWEQVECGPYVRAAIINHLYFYNTYGIKTQEDHIRRSNRRR